MTYGLRSNNMLFLVLVKPSNALYGHVVGLGRTGGEYDILRLSTNQIRNMLWVTRD